MEKELEAVMEEMANAYTEMTGGDYEQIMADACKIIEPLEKEDCERSRKLWADYLLILSQDMRKYLELGRKREASAGTGRQGQRIRYQKARRRIHAGKHF